MSVAFRRTAIAIALVILAAVSAAPAAQAKARNKAAVSAQPAVQVVKESLPHILAEGYSGTGSVMGMQVGELEVDQRQLLTVEHGRSIKVFQHGLFGYEAADGSVQAIDTGLAARSGTFAAAGVGYVAAIDAQARDGITWSDALTGRPTIRLVPLESSPKATFAAVAGESDKLVAPETWPATDLWYVSLGQGVRKHIVVRDPKRAPDRFRFKLERPLRAKTRVLSDGSLAVDLRGAGTIALLPAPEGRAANGVGIPMWFSVKRYRKHDEITLNYNDDVQYVGAEFVKPQPPYDLDPGVFDVEGALGQYATPQASHHGAFATREQGSYVSGLSARVFYPANAYGQWVFSAPPSGASWYHFDAQLSTYLGRFQQYFMYDQAGDRLRVGPHGGATFSSRNISFAPVGFVVSNVHSTTGSIPNDRFVGVLSNTIRTFYDSAPPQIHSLSPANGATVPASFTASVSGSDGQSGCAQDGRSNLALMSVATGAVVDSQPIYGCSGSADLSAVDGDYNPVPGVYRLVATVYDNTGTPATAEHRVTVVPAPSVSITRPAFGNGDAVDATLQLQGTAESPFVQRITVSLDDSVAPIATFAAAPGGFSHEINVSGVGSGTHEVVVSAYDVAGFAGYASAEVIVDHVDPQLAIVEPVAGAYLRSTMEVLFEAHDDHSGIASTKLSLDGSPLTHAFDEQQGAYVAALDTTQLEDGRHTIEASAADRVARQTMRSTTVTIDNTKPLAQIHAPLDQASVSGAIDFSISVDDATAFASYDLALYNEDGRRIELATGNDAGTHTFRLDSERVQNGPYSVLLIALDKAGNETTIEHQLTVANRVYLTGSEAWLSTTGTNAAGLVISHGSGNLHQSIGDASVPALGVSLEAVRSYNHQDAVQGVLGRGWRASFERSISIGLDGAASYIDADGSRHVFRAPIEDDGTFARAVGLDADLTRGGDGSYALRHLDGNVERYDSTGRFTSEQTRTGAKIRVARNGSGEAIQIADDSGLALTLGYAASRLVSISDPLGRTTRYSYDENGQLASATDPAGAVTLYAYDARGRLTSTTDPLGRASSVTYDAQGRVSAVNDARGVETTFTYPGQVIVTVAGKTWSHDVDARGRATAAVDPEGGTVSQEFDDAGHLLSRTDENGATETSEYDAAGNLLAVTDREGNKVSYSGHNEFGQPAKVVDQNGGVTRFGYDAEGNTIKVVKPEGGVITATYDGAGNALSESDASGRTSTSSYDTHGRLIKLVEPGGAETAYQLDAAGQVLAETAPDGGITTYRFDAAGRQLSETDAEGHASTASYDAAGQLVAETDGKGQATSYAYTATGEVKSVSDPAGNARKAIYNAFGDPISETDQNGNSTTFSYNANGDLLAATDPLGATTSYAVDAAGNITAETDPNGDTTAYTYDANGQLVQTENPDGSIAQVSYRSDGSIRSVTDAEGGVTSFGYNADGNETSITDPLGGVIRTIVNADGDEIAEIDELGNRTETPVDELGQPTGAVDADGVRTSVQVDPMGRLLSETDGNGHTTGYGYDKLGQLKSITDPMGGIYAYAYDANGDIVAETDELGRTTRYTYDAAGDLVAATDPEGHTTRFGYDKAGNPVTETDADGNTTTYVYNEGNQIVASVDPSGNATRYAYDGAGNLTFETDPHGQVTTYSYDVNGELTHVRDPGGEVTSYTYNASGDLTSLTDSTGLTTTYAYDADHRVTSESSQLDGTTIYAYTPRGELSSVTDAAGTTTYTYTIQGQIATMGLPDGTELAFRYDSSGNLLSSTGPEGTTSYSYDANDRLTSQTLADGATLTFEYNAAGELTSSSLDGQETSFVYTTSGLLASQTDSTGTTTYQYTPAGLITKITRPNGITTTFEYDPAGQLVTISDSDREQLTFSYDTAGRITSLRQVDGDASYAYDARGQLTNWTRNGLMSLYSYDRRGNMLSESRQVTNVVPGDVPPGIKSHIETCLAAALADCPNPNIRNTIELLTSDVPAIDPASLEGVERHVAVYFANQPVRVRAFQYNLLNQLITSSDDLRGETKAYAYDALGNQTSAGKTTRTYDARNRLISSSGPLGNIRYAYDTRDLRISRTASGATTRYVYDDRDRLVRELRHDGSTIQYTYADTALHSISMRGRTFFYHYNSRGDTTRLTDSSGTTAVRYSYSPWGASSATGDPDLIQANAFTYNGRDGVQYDAATGMHWMRARSYDAFQTRFVQVDPQPSQDDRADAPYLYAGNDPVNNVDPNGTRFFIDRAGSSPPRRIVRPRPRPPVYRPPAPRPPYRAPYRPTYRTFTDMIHNRSSNAYKRSAFGQRRTQRLRVYGPVRPRTRPKPRPYKLPWYYRVTIPGERHIANAAGFGDWIPGVQSARRRLGADDVVNKNSRVYRTTSALGYLIPGGGGAKVGAGAIRGGAAAVRSARGAKAVRRPVGGVSGARTGNQAIHRGAVGRRGTDAGRGTENLHHYGTRVRVQRYPSGGGGVNIYRKRVDGAVANLRIDRHAHRGGRPSVHIDRTNWGRRRNLHHRRIF